MIQATVLALPFITSFIVSPIESSVSDANGPRYVAQDLGTLGGTFAEAFDINNSRQIVGRSSRDTGRSCSGAEQLINCEYAFLWSDGAIVDLGNIHDGADRTTAHAINDAGTIVGYELENQDNGAFYTPLTGTADGIETLPVPRGYSEGLAMDINRSGTIVGFLSSPSDSPNQLATWSANGEVHFETSDSEFAHHGAGINDSGWLVAETYRPHSFRQSNATLHIGGKVTNLGIEGQRSRANAISIFGTVVGTKALSNHAPGQATLWVRAITGTHDPLIVGPFEGDSESEFFAINNVGTAVGSSRSAAGEARAILYKDNVLYDLNTCVTDAPGLLRGAAGINNNGDIVASVEVDGQRRAVLLTPVGQ